MLSVERRNKILDLIKEEKSISCKNLSDVLDVSISTVRNDLKVLENQGELSRLYGGAILTENDLTIAVSKREIINANAKEKIGKKAAELIKNGDIIFLDGSSSGIFMTKYIKNKENVTVITNANRVLLELCECENINLICIGGNYRKKNMTYVGKVTLSTILENYFASKFFFSCLGISMNIGLSDSNETEFDIKRAMAEVSNQRIFLCDATKFGKMGFLKFMDLEVIDAIVTDKPLNDEWMRLLNDKNIEVHVAD